MEFDSAPEAAPAAPEAVPAAPEPAPAAPEPVPAASGDGQQLVPLEALAASCPGAQTPWAPRQSVRPISPSRGAVSNLKPEIKVYVRISILMPDA